MNIQSSKRHSAVTFVCFSALSALSFGVAFEPGQSEAAARGVIAETNQLLSAASSRSDTESYVVEIKPVGTYAAGKEGAVDVVLTAKDPFHVNDAYPYKFRTPDPAPAGITYPKSLLARADGKFDEKTATFRLPFVASKAGKFSIGGTLSLSVCSTANCLMEKVELALDVDVK
jgi:hypothetical protein